MKKRIIMMMIFISMAAINDLHAQDQYVSASGKVQKTIPVKNGQQIRMKFDYPELIEVSTWDKTEIRIEGNAEINGGENNDAFFIETSVSGNYVNINAGINGIKQLPQRVTVWRDGQKIVFRDKEEMKRYELEHGTTFNTRSHGADIDVQLVIHVPKGFPTHIESVYGVVEIKDFDAPLIVESIYGAVDASLQEKAVGELSAETNYGEIFTNLAAKFKGEGSGDLFYTRVTAKPGSGPNYSLESKYGNVYIRRETN